MVSLWLNFSLFLGINGMMLELFKIKEIVKDVVASFLASLVIFIISPDFINPTIAIVSGIASAIITAVLLMALFTLPENHKIQFIKHHPLYRSIPKTFYLALILSGTVVVLAFVFGKLMSLKAILFKYPLTFLTIWTIVATRRCIWLMKKMIGSY